MTLNGPAGEIRLPPLSISPSPLLFGTLAPGQSATKPIVLTGKQPFKVLAISTDTHGLSELDHVELGVTVARRAWITPDQVLNTRTLDELLAWTKRAS